MGLASETQGRSEKVGKGKVVDGNLGAQKGAVAGDEVRGARREGGERLQHLIPPPPQGGGGGGSADKKTIRRKGARPPPPPPVLKSRSPRNSNVAGRGCANDRGPLVVLCAGVPT